MPIHTLINKHQPQIAKHLSTVIPNTLEHTAEFHQTKNHQLKLLDNLRAITSTLHKPHASKNKLSPRQRIACLLDPNSPFLELSPLAAYNMYENTLPAAGIITGIGKIHNTLCAIFCNDYTAKAGTYYPITIKKHLRCQDIAQANKLPCIYLIDSGGVFLPLQARVFPDKEHFGRVFYNQAVMSAQCIPQISLVMGSCTAGGAYMAAMADELVMVKNQGTVFLAGPPLVKAAIGEVVDAETLGGADTHCRHSGVADYYADTEHHALEIARTIVANSRCKKVQDGKKVRDAFSSNNNKDNTECTNPLYDPHDLLGLAPLPNTNTNHTPYDIRQIIARIVDASSFAEFKSLYGHTIVTGMAKIHTNPVGIIANNGVLLSESALKAAHFVQTCCARKTPLLFLQNIAGFMVGSGAEHGGIAKHGAKLVKAVACAQVPKLSVIIGSSYGAGNYGMCGRAFGPDFLWMWPSARIGVMGGAQAGDVLVQIRKEAAEKKNCAVSVDELEALKKETVSKFEEESSALYSTARLWDDGIINPVDTRRVLGLALEIVKSRGVGETRFGIFRM